MNAGELYAQFRSDMQDEEEAYLWSDTDVFRYMDDAYKTFARLTGGIADMTSDFTRIAIVEGEAIAELDKRVLRVMRATRESDGGIIEIINPTDQTFSRDNDYGAFKPIYTDRQPGIVRYMVIGGERNKCQWIQVPLKDDVAVLQIYRLPLQKITEDISPDFEFDEIGEEHVTRLVDWMRSRAYLKADAECFNKGKADEFEVAFRKYCADAKAEWERYKHKNRQIAYGGI